MIEDIFEGENDNVARTGGCGDRCYVRPHFCACGDAESTHTLLTKSKMTQNAHFQSIARRVRCSRRPPSQQQQQFQRARPSTPFAPNPPLKRASNLRGPVETELVQRQHHFCVLGLQQQQQKQHHHQVRCRRRGGQKQLPEDVTNAHHHVRGHHHGRYWPLFVVWRPLVDDNNNCL